MVKYSQDIHLWWQPGHCITLICIPPKVSVTIESSLDLKYSNQRLLQLSSPSWSTSFNSVYLALVLTLLASSWRLSKKSDKNSCASCCDYPRKLLFILPATLLMLLGSRALLLVRELLPLRSYYCCTIPAHAVTISPLYFRAKLSSLCLLLTKYSTRFGVFKRHCKMLFMKHVLPRFRRPG